ncbi:retrovirus-related Pol polyprotein from transposon 17.6 [Trichonephila clavipes]|nr:retrovirus-related Pol polyprotein from transposon 17.6 [Trichonephila clavipes]
MKHRTDTEEYPPIKQHPRRLPFAKQEEVQKLIKDMKNNDVIEPSSSPWASPIVLVRKKDGSTRFCVDYRRLNDVSKKDSYPLPRIDDTLDTLTGNTWFSTLDLKSGYWQVELHPNNKEITSFTTGQGLWQFEDCLVYLDDIIIVGRSFEKHLKNIRRVLQKLKEANLKSSPSKCHLFRREVTYLGHIISAEGVRTDQDKVLAVKYWNCSTDVHQIWSFLGLCTSTSEIVRLQQQHPGCHGLPWPEAYPIPDQGALTVAEVLVQLWISRFGVPLQLHSDQERNFDSVVCKRLCEIFTIDKTRTTALHPQSDGMVERFNRTILNSLFLLVSSNQQEWDKKLPFFLLAYRSAVHETTGYFPSQMLFGRDLRQPADLLFSRPPDAPLAPEEYIEKLQARMEDMHHLARERIGMASEKMKTRYDARATGHDFHEGDKVWLWNPKRRKGLCAKLQMNWEGPYTVLKRLNDVVMRIQKSPHSKPMVIHYSRLAPYLGQDE